MQIKLLVCGDRFFKNYHLMRRILMREGVPGKVACLIEGEAPGADKMSAQISIDLGLPEDKIYRMPADWDKHGKAAGAIRNREMLMFRPHRILAFHENFPESRGTRDMVKIARAAGISTWCSWEENDGKDKS